MNTESLTGSSTPFTVSVVIPTYRRGSKLFAAVRAHLSDPCVSEVVIVDDGSDDDTPAICSTLAKSDERVKVFRQENRGPAAAREHGIARSTSEVVLLIDDDVMAQRHLASKHLAYHKNSPTALVVIGYTPIRLSSSLTRAYQACSMVYARNYERVCRGYEDDPTRALFDLWGGNFSARRDLLLRTTAPPRGLAYHEDRWLGWSLYRLGCIAVFDRNLLAWHDYERSVEQFLRDSRRSGTALAAMLPVAAQEGLLPAGVHGEVLGRAWQRKLGATRAAHVWLRFAPTLIRIARPTVVSVFVARVSAAIEAYRGFLGVDA